MLKSALNVRADFPVCSVAAIFTNFAAALAQAMQRLDLQSPGSALSSCVTPGHVGVVESDRNGCERLHTLQ